MLGTTRVCSFQKSQRQPLRARVSLAHSFSTAKALLLWKRHELGCSSRALQKNAGLLKTFQDERAVTKCAMGGAGKHHGKVVVVVERNSGGGERRMGHQEGWGAGLGS